jgi:hypothetical protein
MRRSEINTVIIMLLLLFIMFTIGCGKKEDTILVTQNCTVSKSGNDGLIQCPDGTELLLPATIITEVITTTPVVISVPKRHCDKENRRDR